MEVPPSPSEWFNGLWNDVLLKSSHLILSSRINPHTAPTPRRVSSKLKLTTEEIDEFKRQLEPFKAAGARLLCIDIFREHVSSRKRILLEKWTLKYEAYPVPRLSSELGIAYKKSVAMMRSLHSQLMFLPTYQEFRRLQKDLINPNRLGYQLSVSESSNSFEGYTPESYAFSTIESQIGAISLALQYLEEPVASPAEGGRMLTSKIVIQDYFTGSASRSPASASVSLSSSPQSIHLQNHQQIAHSAPSQAISGFPSSSSSSSSSPHLYKSQTLSSQSSAPASSDQFGVSGGGRARAHSIASPPLPGSSFSSSLKYGTSPGGSSLPPRAPPSAGGSVGSPGQLQQQYLIQQQQQQQQQQAASRSEPLRINLISPPSSMNPNGSGFSFSQTPPFGVTPDHTPSESGSVGSRGSSVSGIGMQLMQAGVGNQHQHQQQQHYQQQQYPQQQYYQTPVGTLSSSSSSSSLSSSPYSGGSIHQHVKQVAIGGSPASFSSSSFGTTPVEGGIIKTRDRSSSFGSVGEKQIKLSFSPFRENAMQQANFSGSRPESIPLHYASPSMSEHGLNFIKSPLGLPTPTTPSSGSASSSQSIPLLSSPAIRPHVPVHVRKLSRESSSSSIASLSPAHAAGMAGSGSGISLTTRGLSLGARQISSENLASPQSDAAGAPAFFPFDNDMPFASPHTSELSSGEHEDDDAALSAFIRQCKNAPPLKLRDQSAPVQPSVIEGMSQSVVDLQSKMERFRRLKEANVRQSGLGESLASHEKQ